MFPSYRIRDIEIKNGLVLAPMSGVTSCPFRRLILQLNRGVVGLVMTEFISVEGMTRKGEKSLQMMKYDEEERPLAIQIFGYDPERIRDAALMAQDSGVEIVNINCGCPVPKVVKKGGGCELMRQPEHLARIIKEVKKAISIPLTMKIRSGWDDSSKNALEIALMAEREGVEALAIHGRTRSQMYRGMADWEVVGEVAAALKIPVLGSGDVVDHKSALERLAYGVDGLYIGRAALQNPLVFREIALNVSYNLKGSPALQLDIISQYLDLLRQDFLPQGCVGRVKQLVSQMSRGQPWRVAICTARSLPEILSIVESAKDLLPEQERASYSALIEPEVRAIG